MRIWFINQYAVPPSEPGGTRHHALAKALTRRGHDVHVVASSFHYSRQRETRLVPGEAARVEEAEGVPYVWLRTPAYRGNSLGRVRNMAAFGVAVLRRTRGLLRTRPDVVVGSSPHLFGALAAYRLARRMGVPFVLEVRDIWPESLVLLAGASPRHPLVLLFGWIERFLYRRADAIVTLLPTAADHIVRLGGERGRITWVPNGIDVGLFPPGDPPRSGGGTFTVMYAGTHGQANALGSLLDAAEILLREGWGDRILFRFVGDGPEKARLAESAARRGLRNVSFDPPVAKERVNQVLREADVLIASLRDLDLYRHGFSLNKLFDYLAAERPVVLGAASPNPVTEAGAGLSVPPEDARAMADAVRALYAAPEAERRAMSVRGRRFVEENHDFAGLAARLESALLAALGRRGAALDVQPAAGESAGVLPRPLR